MKRILFAAIAAMAMLTGCNKSEFIIYEDIPALYYFSSPGINQLDISGEAQKIFISKGGYPDGSTNASIDVSTSVLIAYNTTSKIQYDLLPAGCYSITNKTVSLEKSKTSAYFEIVAKTENISTLSKGWYAIPLQLSSNAKVKTGSDTAMLVLQKL